MNILNDTLKMVTPDQLDRRTCLKSLTLGAGAVVLQPFLNALAAEARGEAPPPRIIFMLESNGLYPRHIQPKGVDGDNRKAEKLVDLSLKDLELPDAISPLAPFKDRMGIIQKLSHKVSGGGDHGKGFGGLGCFHWRKGVAGQTIDHSLAAAQPSIIPVVGLGVAPNAGAVFVNSVSASAPKRPTPIVCQPDLAFTSLFGSVAEGNAGKAFNARNKLLDWCRSDIKRVRQELPAMDREKLDIYLDTFEQMRTRQEKVAANKDRLKANVPAIDKFNSTVTTDRFEAQCAIATAALASGLTNVVTIDAAGGVGQYHTWKELGVMKDGHAIGHMNGPDEFSVPIRKFHAQRVADLAKRLDVVPEGDGTMLDNTLIVWMSDSGEAHHGFCGEWPLVLVGNLGGRLKTAGRFLQYPAYQQHADQIPGHRTIANLYLALLHAVGDKREQFGEPDLNLKGADQSGPLAEILV
ncbi:DUF1552 domain-containing protein [Lignipirellula cremea]|uniref:DUF1552 domain-containing protein n=1 Tax=Lignipirellula cremea TaxID=2528010 RepID=A0A518DKA5_9BACT|nr:DUF1552 domain-containing protein [Lignipirellula cremea]QDU92267.1 hypothetical protein Pla8534_00120 [Lignipirellula cremea]